MDFLVPCSSINGVVASIAEKTLEQENERGVIWIDNWNFNRGGDWSGLGNSGSFLLAAP